MAAGAGTTLVVGSLTICSIRTNFHSPQSKEQTKYTIMTLIGIYFESLAFFLFRKKVREALSISTIARTHIETSGRFSCVTLVVATVLS